MAWFKPKSLLDQVFEGSLLIKGATGIVEFIGAMILIFLPEHFANSFVLHVSEHLPQGLITKMISDWEYTLWNGQHLFAIVFLLVHSLVKFVIVIGLLRDQRWAYPFSFVTLTLMIAYQTFDIIQKLSVGMVVITVFDVFIFWLIYREYKQHSSNLTMRLSSEVTHMT